MSQPIEIPRSVHPTRRITLHEFDEALHAAVAERGERFIYPEEWRYDDGDTNEPGQCMYVHHDEPACLLGLALHKCGVPLFELECHEGMNASQTCAFAGLQGFTVWQAIGHPHSFDDPLARALDLTQEKQDEGEVWAAALTLWESLAAPLLAAEANLVTR